MTESIHPVLIAADRYRQDLLRREDQSINRLVQAYGTAYQRIEAQIEALQNAIPTGPVTLRDAATLAQLRALRENIRGELNRFGVVADNEMTQLTRDGIVLGIDHSTGMVAAHFSSQEARRALAASFTQLVPEQIETLLGFLADDSPLRTGLTMRLGNEVAERVSQAMIDGMVRGMNPRETAAIVRREFGVGLPWAVSTVRTANLWAYREATRANYVANSRVVSGWIWHATLDRRVCFACISKHGSRHPVTATLNGHHQCRCVMIPEVPLASRLGINLPEIEPGEQWFNRQPHDTQVSIMGPGMLAAYRAGAVRFDQAPAQYEHSAYGTMMRTATMQELGLQRYARNGRVERTGTPVQTTTRRTSTQVAASVRSEIAQLNTAQQRRLAELEAESQRRRDETARLAIQLDELRTLLERNAGTPRAEQISAQIRDLELRRRAEWEARVALRREMDNYRTSQAAQARQLLHVENPSSVRMNSAGQSSETRRLWQAGVDAFNQLVDASIVRGRTVDIVDVSGRASYNPATKVVRVNADSDPAVVLHEIGHWLEDLNPDILRKAVAFHQRRTEGEETAPLYGAISPDEVGRRDRYLDAYMGREYTVGDRIVATEIVSMGLQKFFEDPIRLANEDPDYFDFIFDLLRGR